MNHSSTRDERILERFGYEQELRRGAGIWTTFGVGFATVSPVVGLYSIVAIATILMGPAWIWVLVAVLVGQMLIATTYGELASQFPITGGAYQWTRRVTPPLYAWFTGWVYLWAIFATCTTLAYTSSIFVPLLFEAQPSPNQQLLWAFGFLLLCAVPNALGIGSFRLFLLMGVAAEALASLGAGLILLVFYREHGFGVLLDGLTSFSGQGASLAAILATVAVCGWAFLGFDAVASVSEETHGADRQIPRSIVLSLAAVGAVVVLNAVVVLVVYPDTAALVSGAEPDPVIATVTGALGGWSQRPFLLAIVIAFVACGIAASAYVSRSIYSIARDGLIPCARVLSRVNSRQVPLNAIILGTAASSAGLLLGLNASAIGTMIAFGTGGMFLTMALVTVGALWGRLSGMWQPDGTWKLGRTGLVINVLAATWAVFETINIAWPRESLAPVGATWWQLWAVPVFVALLVITGAAYVWVRKPHLQLERLHVERANRVTAANGTAPATVFPSKAE